MMKGDHGGQQNSCKTFIGVHSTMHLMHPNEGLATVTHIHVHVCVSTMCDSLHMMYLSASRFFLPMR